MVRNAVRRGSVVILAVALLAAARFAGAGEASPEVLKRFDDLCGKARRSLEAGKGSEAIAHLQRAIAVIQESGLKDLASFFPPAPAGWTAEDPEKTSGSWGAGGESFQWTNATRRYRRERDDLVATITVTNQPQLVQGQETMAQMLKNPMYAQAMNQDPNKKIEVFEQKGWTGWKIIEKGNSAQVVALCQSLMLMVEIPDDDGKAMDGLWGKIDLKGLAEAAASM